MTRSSYFLTFYCLFLLILSAFAATEYGKKQYTEYSHGAGVQQTLPILLSSPHGGEKQPNSVADRNHGCYINGECVWDQNGCTPDEANCRAVLQADYNTQDLTRLVAAELETITGLPCHFVINRLHRIKLDANREIDEAAQGDKNAKRAWEEYHTFMETAKSAIETDWGKGLVLDMHGQNHQPENWTEIGYALSASQLNSGDLPVDKASIRALAERNESGLSFEEILRGSTSFGGLLDARLYKTVPSPSYPSPNGGDYFTGGYITRRYGSRDGGNVDCIQIESQYYLRKNAAVADWAKNVAEVTLQYLSDHYGFSFP